MAGGRFERRPVNLWDLPFEAWRPGQLVAEWKRLKVHERSLLLLQHQAVCLPGRRAWFIRDCMVFHEDLQFYRGHLKAIEEFIELRAPLGPEQTEGFFALKARVDSKLQEEIGRTLRISGRSS
ncbi:hypothetical protein [Deinococcus misasensis]|uniref:hypothetical protein n=1 Tax=Deinococcus misasensis TaxID=392413 RepID=UPI000550C732|nr:hypothetical protein [Deinococcus misasensis]